ncbi:phosphoglycolate phosphatase-like HAD superfamily hydrolase [Paenibacillus shirakamiensis]|uniref:Phosphoglycolate phosphatase-like HAD superfamily hydrolase n=1 Tax=Paenibacillus shirakamiensis TaxID=1265935 RepID=A0ABS4JEH5_9BACL|nr:HAD hydrolase-like protein [Paenibacillus shirakamiensis]MBP2000098.1 phosphoglycolate phosphatase-like HAD superfamily hydrolase [Paenibacillus shirakamiensis]
MGRKHGINLDEMLYIGDEIRDVEACKKINVTVVAVTWGWDSPELLKEAAPNFICHTPMELEKLIVQGK